MMHKLVTSANEKKYCRGPLALGGGLFPPRHLPEKHVSSSSGGLKEFDRSLAAFSG